VVTPFVVVVKSDGQVRLCGDYRSIINRALAAGTVFAKFDMAQAYLQLNVDQEAANAQTIISGAFRCKRLQFGVSIAPQIFQMFMDLQL